jgi:hypothetical protein
MLEKKQKSSAERVVTCWDLKRAHLTAAAFSILGSDIFVFDGIGRGIHGDAWGQEGSWGATSNL